MFTFRASSQFDLDRLIFGGAKRPRVPSRVGPARVGRASLGRADLLKWVDYSALGVSPSYNSRLRLRSERCAGPCAPTDPVVVRAARLPGVRGMLLH